MSTPPATVAMLVMNDVSRDARVMRSAHALAAGGYHVVIVGTEGPRAFGSEQVPTPAGVPGSVRIDRVPVVRIDRALDLPARWLARLLRRGGNAPGAPATSGRDQLAAATGPAARVTATLTDLVLRVHRPLVVLSFWVAATAPLRAARPTVVHAHDANTLVPALRAGVPVVYDSHELWTGRNRGGRRPVAERFDALLERWAIRRVAAVVTVSPGIVDWLQRRYRLPRPPVLVRNIPEPAPPRHTEQVVPLRERCGVEEHTPLVAYVGVITANRGLEPFIAAMAEVPEVHLGVLGHGDPEAVQRIRRAALHAGVADRVHLAGSVPHHLVTSTLTGADASLVYVEPLCLSYRFALPNKLFESLHAHIPVVVADLPDAAELVRRYGAGVVAPDAGVDSLTRAIRRLLEDPHQVREGARRAAQELTWDGEADRLRGLYRDLLASRA